jgi:hypothetical protein
MTARRGAVRQRPRASQHTSAHHDAALASPQVLCANALGPRENATRALWHLSSTPDNQLMIAREGALPALVANLSADSDRAQEFAAAAMESLSRDCPENQVLTQHPHEIAPRLPRHRTEICPRLPRHRTEIGPRLARARAGAIAPLRMQVLTTTPPLRPHRCPSHALEPSHLWLASWAPSRRRRKGTLMATDERAALHARARHTSSFTPRVSHLAFHTSRFTGMLRGRSFTSRRRIKRIATRSSSPSWPSSKAGTPRRR